MPAPPPHTHTHNQKNNNPHAAEPRNLSEPCVGPRGFVAKCADGLVCDSETTMACQRPAEVGDLCWPGRPCVANKNCSPTTRRCVDAPGGNNDPCGVPGEADCGTGFHCHPTRRRCARYQNEREACFTLATGEELKCASPFFCFPRLHICYHNPSDAVSWFAMTMCEHVAQAM